MSPKKIIKESDVVADFNIEKLMVSLTKSGASESVVQKIATEIETLHYDGITTREIYKNTLKKL